LVEPLCDVAAATKEDVDAAVQAAKACLYSQHWGYASTGLQRAAILRKLGDIITERTEELARLDSLDHGKVCVHVFVILIRCLEK
jgi:acyl-CoA reductase-like NAD-dependent aldehyde dehydrogenase